MTYRADTYCGLYCGACAAYLANKRDELEEIAKAWSMPAEDLHCHGCKSETLAVFCRDCDLRNCAIRHQVESCGECPEYPCEQLLAFRHDQHPHHSVIVKNLDSLRLHGLEPWLEQQRDRWSCPTCRREFSWYEKSCRECGAELYESTREEKDLENCPKS
jgi:hypothetical protein